MRAGGASGWTRGAIVVGSTIIFSGCAREAPHSSDWVAALPEGEIRRKIVLGCTPCHQTGVSPAVRRTSQEWEAILHRMKAIDRRLDLALIPFEDGEIARWLAREGPPPRRGRRLETAPAEIREYPLGEWEGFYHDMALAGGKAWTANYFTNRLYGVDPVSGSVESYDIPIAVEPGKPGGAHQLDTTPDGTLWITFTKAEQVARFDPVAKTFRIYSGFPSGGNIQYFVLDAHRQIYQDAGGGIWMTHFSKEILSRLDPQTGQVTVYPTPRSHPLPEKGVHLYAAVADSSGRLWYTETHGNRLGRLDPATGRAEEWEIFEPYAGPKRLAIDEDDRLWIPELATGKITVYDTRSMTVTDRLSLPIPGDYPYAIRRNPHTGDLWVTGSGSDCLYRLDPRSRRFTIYRLPRHGAYTRTIAFDKDGGVWTNYASYPNTQTLMPHRSGVIVRLIPQERS